MNDIRNGINRRRLLRGAGAAAGMIGVGSLGVPARVEARASSSSASGNLVILHSSDDQPYLEYLKANFAKDFPNVTVEIQGVGYDQLYTKESTVLASGSDFDRHPGDGPGVDGGFCQERLVDPAR